MYFLQAAQAPIEVDWAGLKLSIDRYLMPDVVAWGQEILQKRTAELTEGMDDEARRQYLNYYPPIEPDLNELRRLLRTPSGIEKVMRDCLAKAVVKDADGKQRALAPEEVDQIWKVNGAGRLGTIARVLADLDETNPTPPPGDDSGPLAQSNKGSAAPSKTGASASPSSTASTGKTPGSSGPSPSSSTASAPPTTSPPTSPEAAPKK